MANEDVKLEKSKTVFQQGETRRIRETCRMQMKETCHWKVAGKRRNRRRRIDRFPGGNN